MKSTLKKSFVRWFSVVLTLAIGAVYLLWAPGHRARREVEHTRRELQTQGFKVDLSEFQSPQPPETRDREQALRRAMDNHIQNPVMRHPDLLPAAGDDISIVVWQQEWLEGLPEEAGWPQFSAMVRANQSATDTAAAVLLSGPIAFQAQPAKGLGMLLPHLAAVKGLSLMLGSRVIVDLHDGNSASAWTNLLAQTRLATAWDPGIAEISHLVRFANAHQAFRTTWQALQTNVWTDEQLLRLQQEWQSLELFREIPETIAFKRAGALAACRDMLKEPFDWELAACFKELIQSPRRGWTTFVFRWREFQYRNRGTFHDQTALLRHYRDREKEFRSAIEARSWNEMQTLPGITNTPLFQSQFRHSRIQAMLNLREIGTGIQRGVSPLMRRAAEAEAIRRVIVTALAVERFQRKHGVRPESLDALVPEFLSAPPVDFIDGRPLRYRVLQDGRFVLYSLGGDGIDDGGFLFRFSREAAHFRDMPFHGPQKRRADLIWPRPATDQELKVHEARLLAEATQEFIRESLRTSIYVWDLQSKRQKTAATLADHKRVARPSSSLPAVFQELTRALNQRHGTAKPLEDFLALQRVNTGDEPEQLTFELPIPFHLVPTNASLSLLVDFHEMLDRFERQSFSHVSCNPGPDGNVRLILRAIFETPGRHTIQAVLQMPPDDFEGDQGILTGQPLAVDCDHLCQFGVVSTGFDPIHGAPLHMWFAEPVADYRLHILTTNQEPIRVFAGTTTNGTATLHWDLTDEEGRRWKGDFFDSIVHVRFPGSGRLQTLKGP